MKLFFRRYGNGPALVILHGLYGSSDNWVTSGRKLSEKFTVILPDLRNHGQSPHNESHTYDDLASDIHELAEDLKLEKFILAGHSMGGRAAMKFALKWPEKINALIVIDISPFGSVSSENKFLMQHREILEALRATELTGVLSRAEAEMMISGKIPSEKIRGFLMKNLRRLEDGSFDWKINIETLLEHLPQITGGIIGENENNTLMEGFPVLFVKGGNSDYLPEKDFGKIQNVFPAAEFITVQNAGHWVHSDRPDAIEDLFFKLV